MQRGESYVLGPLRQVPLLEGAMTAVTEVLDAIMRTYSFREELT
jgi:hypothetical protein